jgi:rSAM/selenodomain-associated transferase 1
MRGRPQVIVFARAPVLGAVKRRLARSIGDAAARRSYVEITRSVLDRLAGWAQWRLALAVTPDRFARRGRFWPDAIGRVPQKGGDLGQRMERALLLAVTRPAIIVGSDVPGIDARHIRAALAALGDHDIVFGPATDGGYWLVGVRHPRLARGLFRNVRWSSAHALADTLANVARRRRVKLIEPLEDVDDDASWQRWSRRAGLGRASNPPRMMNEE